jgi:hypothetical protein
MQRWENTDGPYLRWLQYVERTVGPRVWNSLCRMDAASALSIMAALGVKPYEKSEFFGQHEHKQILVTHVTSDWLRPLPGEPDGPAVLKDPRLNRRRSDPD